MVVLLSTISSSTFANQTAENPASNAFVPMILALLFIVVVIFAIAFVAKKLNLTPHSNQHIKLVSSTSLGGRERIVIVEVQGKQHAIGVSQHNVNYLFDVPEPVEAPSLPFAQSGFADTLSKLLKNQTSKSSTVGNKKDN